MFSSNWDASAGSPTRDWNGHRHECSGRLLPNSWAFAATWFPTETLGSPCQTIQIVNCSCKMVLHVLMTVLWNVPSLSECRLTAVWRPWPLRARPLFLPRPLLARSMSFHFWPRIQPPLAPRKEKEKRKNEVEKRSKTKKEAEPTSKKKERERERQKKIRKDLCRNRSSIWVIDRTEKTIKVKVRERQRERERGGEREDGEEGWGEGVERDGEERGR